MGFALDSFMQGCMTLYLLLALYISDAGLWNGGLSQYYYDSPPFCKKNYILNIPCTSKVHTSYLLWFVGYLNPQFCWTQGSLNTVRLEIDSVKVKRQTNHPSHKLWSTLLPTSSWGCFVVKDWGRMYTELWYLYFLQLHRCSKCFLECTYAGEPTAVCMHAIHTGWLCMQVVYKFDWLICYTRHS